MNEPIRIIVVGNPTPWTSQHRNAARSASFLRMQAWQGLILEAARHVWIGLGLIPETRPVSLDMVFYLAPSQITNRLPYGPDATNLYKAAEDALTGTVYLDDRQTLAGNFSKRTATTAIGLTVITVSLAYVGLGEWPSLTARRKKRRTARPTA